MNLHVHGQGNDPEEVVRQARGAEIDLLAITDHQSFRYYSAIARAAAAAGRPLTVLPGIEITAEEGVHLIAIFPTTFSETQQQQFVGWLDIDGSGSTQYASPKTVDDILPGIHERGGITVIPHPNTPKIGFLDSARKIGTKIRWLESGHIRLMQASEGYVRYVERDESGNFINRFVLASAESHHIRDSTYCLAPFNRSDAHAPSEIPDGCSWFRMSEPSLDGLRQAACEPRTRISRRPVADCSHDYLLAVRISGGYCDGQIIRLNEGLNCVIGQNYAGKSAVFDFIRFALGHERDQQPPDRWQFLNRVNGILGEDGTVELFLRRQGALFAVKRTFKPVKVVHGREHLIDRSSEEPSAYRLHPDGNDLVPAQDFEFPIEVYEQGRISRLRSDVDRQLDMLDEFASLGGLKRERDRLVDRLRETARVLRPLYEERESLKSDLAALPELKAELAEKEQYLPGEEEAKWANADRAIRSIESSIKNLRSSAEPLTRIKPGSGSHPASGLAELFGQSCPEVGAVPIAEEGVAMRWADALRAALEEIDRARMSILAAVQRLEIESAEARKTWVAARREYQEQIRAKLTHAKVDSPTELIDRVADLRVMIDDLEQRQKPRLKQLDEDIRRHEGERTELADALAETSGRITAARQQKAQELTDSLGGQIKIEVLAAANRDEYRDVLHELCNQITSAGHKIQNREGQLGKIISSLTPLELARALIRRGNVEVTDGTVRPLTAVCGVTENTQNVLCRIADNVELLSRLQTATVADAPQIMVRRRGEDEYANLRTGLSQGEQSAAILTLALQTRRRPLIIDQPEDELGYSFVVHLIVPKILEVKSSRQILVITHNANIPVLGDADHVTQMENRPQPGGGRRCVVARHGCFESAAITKALIELEGGVEAFQFRRYRYTLPRSTTTS